MTHPPCRRSEITWATRFCFRTLLIIPLSFATTAHPQQRNLNPPHDVQASVLAQRSLEFMGASGIVPGQGIELQGNLTLQGKSSTIYPILIEGRSTRELHVELSTPFGRRVTVISADGHGQIRYPDGKTKVLSESNIIGTRNDFLPDLSLLSEYASGRVSIESEGQTLLNDAKVNVIVLGVYAGPSDDEASRLAKRTRTEFYLDSTSGEVLMLKRSQYPENGFNDPQAIEIHYSDYRNIDGVMVPFRQETYADAVLLTTLVLTSANINISTSDSDFSLVQ